MEFFYIDCSSFRYMKYLYPYECDKRGLSNPNELQAAIDSNRREGRRQSFGSSLFTYSPNGTPTMLSSPKIPTSGVGLTVATNGASMTPIQKIKKGEICSWEILMKRGKTLFHCLETHYLLLLINNWFRWRCFYEVITLMASLIAIREMLFYYLRSNRNLLSTMWQESTCVSKHCGA